MSKYKIIADNALLGTPQSALPCGVPQGFILATILFSICYYRWHGSEYFQSVSLIQML